VLLHGGQSDHREWRRQLEGLSDGFDVVAWDAPGCGASSDPPEDFPLDAYADTLAAFMDALGLEPAHVAGLSFGSGLAIELQRRHPERVASLVLVSPYAGWAGSLSQEEIAARLDGFAQMRPGDELPGLFGPGASPEAVAECAAIAAEARLEALGTMVRAFAVADLRPALPAIDVPTLVLHGDADVRSPPHVARAIHAAIPGAEIVSYEAVGHMLNVEAPERFNRELRAFVGGLG
jgi:pimeloyl-ACP methyl ester carboxylesterase